MNSSMINLPLFYDGPSVSSVLPSADECCRILSTEEAMASLMSKSYNPKVLALFSSLHGGILSDPHTMAIPFSDHMVHRGHAVFDTATLLNGRVYRLDAHLERFYRSIRLAQINHPFMSHQQVKEIIMRTCAATGKKDAVIRFWLSAGGCDFAIHPRAGVPTFWVAVMDAGTSLSGELFPGKEVSISASHVPMKPGLLAKSKTTNYLLNALCSIEASRRGGSLGIWLEEDGRLAEASIASIVVVSKEGVVKVPHLDKILSGITLQRVYDVTSEVLSITQPGPYNLERTIREDIKTSTDLDSHHDSFHHHHHHSGRPIPMHIKGIERCHMTIHDLYESEEMMAINGDCFFIPITELDHRQIGSGEIGPFTKWIHSELLWEGRSGTRFIDPVNYDRKVSHSSKL